MSIYELTDELRINRLRQRITVVNIGRRSGISPTTLGRLERGAYSSFSLDHLDRWAEALGLKVEYSLRSFDPETE